MHTQPPSHTSSRRNQGGVALLFALLTLVALMLATLGLVRSVDTSTMLMGNIGFKQEATAATDRATRQALTDLNVMLAALNTDSPSSGYYASTTEIGIDGVTRTPIDVTGKQLEGTANRQLIDWDNDNCKYASEGTFTACVQPKQSADINNQKAAYVIFRLCSKPGDYNTDTTISCAKPLNAADTESSKKDAIDTSNPKPFTIPAGPYYRVVVRVLGARNTASFSETIVHF